MKKTVVFVMFVCLGCSNEQDSQSNEDCEAECAVDFLETVTDCESDSLTCLIDCEGPEDNVCIDSCRQCWELVSLTMTVCTEDCPCLSTFVECEAGCDSHECVDWCTNNYNACSGDSSYYNIISSCLVNRADCEISCEGSTSDIQEYLDCTILCNSDFNDCILDLAQ